MPSTLLEALGIQVLASEAEDTVCAIMKVTPATCQPYGILHGGASLALAETVAGHGSMLILPKELCPVGSTVTGTHISTARVGTTLHAKGTLLHRGKKTHLWNVDITDDAGKLISTARVLNHIIPLPPCCTSPKI